MLFDTQCLYRHKHDGNLSVKLETQYTKYTTLSVNSTRGDNTSNTNPPVGITQLSPLALLVLKLGSETLRHKDKPTSLKLRALNQ